MWKLSREDKERLACNIQAYFTEQGWEKIGNLEAEFFVAYLMEEIGPYAYNRGVEDARQIVTERLQQTEDEMYTLERPIRR